MMKTSSKMLFMMTTLLSTMIVISSSNWLNMWIGLEINLLSFIPLMFKSKNSFLSQSSMMYFLIQSIASAMLIIIILSNKYMFYNMYNQCTTSLIMLMMMMKMGSPPFHMWFPEIMSKMSWNMCAMLMTWQKVAPMYVMSINMDNNKLTMIIITMSTLVGALMGLNHSSTRKIMAYSSINHMGWMMACAMLYKKLWIMYMMMYSTMIMMMCVNMKKYNIMYINQFNIKSLKMMEKLSFMVMMLSTGGLPPFMGFMPKWMTIEYMIMSNEMFMLTMMMLSSLITLSYYMRMISSINMMTSNSQKWILLNKTTKKSTTIMLFINLSMPMLIMLMNFM